MYSYRNNHTHARKEFLYEYNLCFCFCLQLFFAVSETPHFWLHSSEITMAPATNLLHMRCTHIETIILMLEKSFYMSTTFVFASVFSYSLPCLKPLTFGCIVAK